METKNKPNAWEWVKRVGAILALVAALAAPLAGFYNLKADMRSVTATMEQIDKRLSSMETSVNRVTVDHESRISKAEGTLAAK